MAANQNDSDKRAHESQSGRPSTAAPVPAQEAEVGAGEAATGEPRFRVVGIGASAGGLEALCEFLKAMRADSEMVFVVVSHLDPEHKSALAEILSRVSAMPVHEIEDGMTIAPDHVYVIPANRDLVIAQDVLHLTRRVEGRVPQMPVDTFLRSLAKECGTRAIGVILSGTGTDGTLGLKAIKEEGGLTFAQDETAKYSGMPHSAAAAGVVDRVLPPARLAAELFRISRQAPVARAREAPPPEESPEGEVFLQILRLLGENSGVDFVNYKHSTLHRRIERRMVLQQIQSLDLYLRRLRDDATEWQVLFEEVLIPVTSFFRDPDSYEALKSTVFPRLMAGRPHRTPLRVWVPGCASGEEAYSVGICLLEFLGSLAEAVPIKIFASDLSERAIDAARAGVYGEGIAADVSPSVLRVSSSRPRGATRSARRCAISASSPGRT